MLTMESRWLDVRQLDEMASKETVIHQIHPCAKLVTTVIFLTVVASFSKYEVIGLLPLLLYPMVIFALGDLPVGAILRRVLLTVPFVIFIGIFNPLFDQVPYAVLGPIVLSGGWISFLSILLRFFLAVTAALLLVGTTGMDAIGMALLKFRVPRIFVIQLLFMYRYLYVLLEEFIRTIRAYSLRSFQGDGLKYKVWGSLLGQLLLRTIDRAQRIYQAMLCRGFDGEIRMIRPRKLMRRDIVYCLGWSILFIMVRFINIPQWLGNLLIGGS